VNKVLTYERNVCYMLQIFIRSPALFFLPPASGGTCRRFPLEFGSGSFLLGASNWFSLVSPFPNSLGPGFWLVVLWGCSWEFRAGVYAGGLCVWVVFLAGHYAFFLWVGLISSGISAMERNFTVESKSFSLSV
jgi:hypothetical protein